MSDQRVIIEMGMGNDQYGQDYTKAAARALEDAIRHSSLPLFGPLGLSSEDMRVVATVAVQEPDALDLEALKACLPRGQVELRTAHGGLNVINPDDGNVIVIASAAVEAFLPNQAHAWRAP